MKRTTAAAVAVVAFALGVGAGRLLTPGDREADAGGGNSGGPRAASAYASAPAPAGLALATATRRDFVPELPWSGRVRSREVVRVVALTDGTVAGVQIADEVAVETGDLLFTLGGVRVEQRRRNLRARVTSLEERSRLAAATAERARKLAADKALSLDAVQRAEDLPAELGGALRQARADLEELEASTRIGAGRDGVFTRRAVAVGQEVEAGDVLAEIIDPTRLRIVATVFPRDQEVAPGCRAAVRRAGGDEVSGEVREVLAATTAAGGTVVWIEGEELVADGFRPGQAVRGRLLLPPHRNALGLPARAIVHDQRERPRVLVKRPQGIEVVAVSTGLVSAGGWVEITSGLDARDQVVLDGAYELYHREFRSDYVLDD